MIEENVMMEAISQQAKTELEENGVMLFQAEVHDIYPDGSVNLRRDHNVQPDGTTLPDNAPSVVVNLAQKININDTVICLLSGGHAYVLGVVYTKKVISPEMNLQDMKSYIDDELKKLNTRVDNVGAELNSFIHSHVTSSNSTHSDMNKRIGEKLAIDRFETFLGDHITSPRSTHQNLNDRVRETELSIESLKKYKASRKHRHGWVDITNRGVHNNDHHEFDYVGPNRAEDIAEATVRRMVPPKYRK